ncbi:MAG: hypothetical protein RMZ43_000885 [Nostoc sp. CmiVER01]|uniref:hypothetical protein n=1 Tax=Nostoc sp. CmiVER01 TaxID=3075384 RepID=UPI002AD31E81|nr:hypothetical protein [Nostoc sp. CmiVER01]MDZ8123739.1 hypothetical protein [Nostoc sp. CmiVER01]
MMKNIHSFSYCRGKTKLLLLLAGFFFLLGISFLCTFESVELACKRVNVNQINCSLTRSAAFRFLRGQEIHLNFLREVKLDKRFKETVESDGDHAYVNKTPIYGVLLISNKTTVLNGYAYNREKQQNTVNQFNTFLNDSNAENVVVQEKNYLLNMLTLSSLGLSFILLFLLRFSHHF